MTFGSCPTYVPFVNHYGYFCTDLTLPYWGDVFLQPGKLSDADSNYLFLRSWWQTKDIEALIDSQSKLGKDVEKTWDVEALRAVKEIATTKDEKAKTPAEKEKNINTEGGVELITGFQRGVGAKFYTFHVQSTGTGSDKKHVGTIVRTKSNKDPRGELPISFAYGDTDGSNPLGRSVVELVGGMQNLMDAETQMYQYNRALQLNPPVHIFGINVNKFKYAPNTVVKSTNPDAFVKPVEIDTTALTNFPANYQLMQSQLLTLLASPNSNISAEVGNITQSKTPQGVEQNKANLNIDDNHYRKQFETWFERWSETAINLYFAERTGVEELQLDKKTAQELTKLAQEGKFNPELLSDDNKIRIDYDSATPALKFEVDASTSKMQDEAEQLQALTLMEEFLRKSPILQKIVPPSKQVELWNAFVRNTKIEDPEKLALDEKEIQESMSSLQGNEGDDIQDRVTAKFETLPDWAKAQWYKNHNFEVPEGVPMSAPLPEKTESVSQPDNQMKPEHILKADDQAHKQGIDSAKIEMEMRKMDLEDHKMMMEMQNQSHTQTMSEKQHQLAVKQANKPKGVKASGTR